MIKNVLLFVCAVIIGMCAALLIVNFMGLWLQPAAGGTFSWLSG